VRQIAAVSHRTPDYQAADLGLLATVLMAWHCRAASEPAQTWFRSLLIEAANHNA
jgi:hypothetical protein